MARKPVALTLARGDKDRDPLQEAITLLKPSQIIKVEGLYFVYWTALPISDMTQTKVGLIDVKSPNEIMLFERHTNPDGTFGGFVSSLSKENVAKGAYVAPTAVVGPGCLLKSGTRVGEGACIERVELHDKTSIGPNSRLINTTTTIMLFGNSTVSGDGQIDIV